MALEIPDRGDLTDSQPGYRSARGNEGSSCGSPSHDRPRRRSAMQTTASGVTTRVAETSASGRECEFLIDAKAALGRPGPYTARGSFPAPLRTHTRGQKRSWSEIRQGTATPTSRPVDDDRARLACSVLQTVVVLRVPFGIEHRREGASSVAASGFDPVPDPARPAARRPSPTHSCRARSQRARCRVRST